MQPGAKTTLDVYTLCSDSDIEKMGRKSKGAQDQELLILIYYFITMKLFQKII